MERSKVFRAGDYGAVPDGTTVATGPIQAAIDAAEAAGGGRVEFDPGTYLTGSLFLKSHVELHVAEGVTLLGVASEEGYPEMWSRVAGIEMNWPAGLVNICGQEHAAVTGPGTIDGQGNYWWDKYWSMREAYTPRGLRWAADYDCKRPRNLLVLDSSHIRLENFTSLRSGFWNVHICYSEHVTVDGLTIRENQGPSTDGIDIDSSSHVLVENCSIDCNDDNLCIKSGRDADGLRVNLPAEHIVIRNCYTGEGAGITLGSETSGPAAEKLPPELSERS
ncbi:MAG: endopolygalacturonase [Paenibacillaceae bacterium]|nr:endopolygalacturonase [Paenibacillaceae bacterium]